MNPIPVAVDEDLDLDVAVFLDPALEVHRVIAERGAGLGARERQRGFHLAPPAPQAHAGTAASCARKPSPGWIAAQPVIMAALISAGWFRYERRASAGPMQIASSAI